jgi:hypothetical protein
MLRGRIIATSENPALRCCNANSSPIDPTMLASIVTKSCGRLYGSGEINNASTNEKIVALAAMATAIVTIAVAAKPGARRSERNAKRASCRRSASHSIWPDPARGPATVVSRIRSRLERQCQRGKRWVADSRDSGAR